MNVGRVDVRRCVIFVFWPNWPWDSNLKDLKCFASSPGFWQSFKQILQTKKGDLAGGGGLLSESLPAHPILISYFFEIMTCDVAFWVSLCSYSGTAIQNKPLTENNLICKPPSQNYILNRKDGLYFKSRFQLHFLMDVLFKFMTWRTDVTTICSFSSVGTTLGPIHFLFLYAFLKHWTVQSGAGPQVGFLGGRGVYF